MQGSFSARSVLTRREGAPAADANTDAIRREVERQSRSEYSGRLISDVAVPAAGAQFVVAHKLGRAPRGYYVVRWTVEPPAFFEVSADAKRITFESTSVAGQTVALMVF